MNNSITEHKNYAYITKKISIIISYSLQQTISILQNRLKPVNYITSFASILPVSRLKNVF